MSRPSYGEVWLVDPNPVVGQEQAHKRPFVVISDNEINARYHDLVIALPFTSRNKNFPWHVCVASPEGGLPKTSYAMPEQIRAISMQRFMGKPLGRLSPMSMHQIKMKMFFLFDMYDIAKSILDAPSILT